MRTTFFAIAATLLAGARSETAAQPIRLHPENHRYFEFRGKPTVLITSGEHYGAVLNLDFDFIPYLDELQKHGFNQTRLFSGTYRETPGSFKIASNTLAPRTGKFLGPYARTDRPGARDGGAKFDLDRWDPAYFKRLRAFVTAASERGIVVEFVLFCPFYEDGLWNVNAWNPANNVNRTPNLPRTEVYTGRSPLLDRQVAFTREIVWALNEFDNLYYEICNEPYFGGVTLDWQAKIAETIVATESLLPKKHMIAQNIANGKAKIEHPNPAVSLFNFHYARPPETVRLNLDLDRALGDDETGFQGTDDRVYRIEAWEFLLAGGASFSNLDYSFTVEHPDGTAKVEKPTPGGGGPTYRAGLAHLARFMNGIPFLKMRPDDSTKPVIMSEGGKIVHTLIESGGTIAGYARGAGSLSARLPAGRYRVERHDPAAGRRLDETTLESKGAPIPLPAPPGTASDEFAFVIRPIK